MLVLSRRLNEKIYLPGIRTAIQVLGMKPGTVRLGIDAPEEVAVFREEVWQRDRPVPPPRTLLEDAAARARLHELNHLLRNRLNGASIGLALLRRQVQGGLAQAAAATLDRIERELQALQGHVAGVVENAPDRRGPPAKVCKALLVEDDTNERELLAGLLRLAGLDVATAGDGCDALDYLRTRGRPDVVLLDMMLPRCDGAATVRAIRHEPAYAGLKIFALSGHTPDRFGLDPGAAGIDRWFRKPVNPEALLRDLSRDLQLSVGATAAGPGA